MLFVPTAREQLAAAISAAAPGSDPSGVAMMGRLWDRTSAPGLMPGNVGPTVGVRQFMSWTELLMDTPLVPLGESGPMLDVDGPCSRLGMHLQSRRRATNAGSGEHPLAAWEAAAARAEAQAGWAMLVGLVPDLARWVATAVPMVALLPTKPLSTSNFSTTSAPLCIFTSPRLSSKFAEVLVHEAAHQVAHLVDPFLTLVQQSDFTYTPAWRPDPRPARALLRGAHAFAFVALVRANIARWERMAADAPGPREHAAAALEAAGDVEVVLDALTEARVLTESGTALVQGLRKVCQRAKSRLVS
jgi:HEXXH motif-containing protein